MGRAILGCLLFFFLLLSSLTAQSPNGNIVGRVQDQSGALVPGAKITVQHAATGEFRQVTSDDKGEYTVAELSPGNYTISVEKPGFRRTEERGLTLEVDQTARLDIQLQLGPVAEVLEVTASVPLLNTESAMKGDVIVSREMADIPLNGRDFADLAYLVPGVGEKAQGGNGSNFAVNGARADNTNFIIDGFNDQNLRAGGVQASPPLDAMMEFKMQTTGYSAEYGRLAGGTMNMVLRSGTNRPHGVLFEFLRNDAFDARGFFDPEKTKLRRNQFGAMLDGPVYIPKLYHGRDRTFFLFSWESYRQSLGDSQISRVPTELERQGNFSRSLDVDGLPARLVDPLSGGSSGACAPGKTGACFPGNIIPASRLDSIAKQVMAYYPAINRGDQVNNYYGLASDPDQWDSFLAKIDQRLRGSDSLSGRFLKRFNRNTDPFAGSETGLFGNYNYETQMLAGLTYTRLFSPTLINEARFGFTRSSQRQYGITMGRDYAAEWGLTGSTKDPALLGFPRFTVTDMAPLGNAKTVPVLYTINNFQWADTMTWVKSRHLLKFGVDALRNQFFQPFFNNNRGTYAFNGYWTTVPLADMELGILNKFSRTVGSNPSYLFFTSYSAFAQDDFRVSPSLTLNVGLRYELSKPPLEKYGRYSNFIPELGQLIIATDQTIPNLQQVVAGVGLAGKVSLARDAGLPESLVYTPTKAFAPRIGFAWRPLGGVRTVVRGGYGIFYGNNMWNQIRKDMGDVFPFTAEESYNKVNKQPQTLTLRTPLGVSSKLDGVLTPNGFQLHPAAQYLQSWNMTVEREIGNAIALEAAYIGSKGTHLGRSYNLNQPFRLATLAGSGFPRPFAAFNDINYYAFGSNSIYNAGVFTLRKRFARGLFYRLNYIYSKSLDDSSQVKGGGDGGSNAQDARNLALERARSDWDRGHSVTAMFMYDLPFRGNVLLNNWQVGGTGRFQSGPPFSAVVSSAQLDQGEADRPDRLAKGTLPNPTPDMWFDRSAFAAVPAGAYHFGTSGRNILDAPGLIDLNVSLIKRFRVRERYTVQLRCESFNTLNHANFNLPNGAVNAPDGGTITRSRSPRLLQFGMRVQF